MTAKPTVSELGIDLAAQVWHRSGRGDGAIEVAFARAGDSVGSGNPDASGDSAGSGNPDASGDSAGSGNPDASGDSAGSGDPPADHAEWVLLRVAGDRDQRVLVFDRHEWECFLDGARNGEFDDACC